MDNSSTPDVEKPTHSVPLGMHSFSKEEQKQFGQDIRLAMACIEGKPEPLNIKAIPTNAQDIRQRLKILSQDITSSHADLLELLVRFDDLEGWKSVGASHCAAWMNLEIGISLQLGWEYLRVGRKLRLLPTTTALFRAGKLTWSKVRLIASVADSENERTLCHAALDGSVSEVKRLCNEYRWQEDDKNEGEENHRAIKQLQSRSLTWQETSIGSTRIQLTLPPEMAQAFLNSVEHSVNLLDKPDIDGINDNTSITDSDTCTDHSKQSEKPDDTNISQRRADAAVLMAENSLQYAGREIAAADRYQVIVSIDASDIKKSSDEATPLDITSTDAADTTSMHAADSIFIDTANPTSIDTANPTSIDTANPTSIHAANPTSATTQNLPSKRPTLKNAGPIARETARRIACDCSVSTHTTSDGELMDIGRRSRIWPNAMSRAIKARDEHCQFPGCTRTHHLPIHHIKHWADGGETKITNGVSLCTYHHTLVHEGGYTIEWASESERRMNEQFEQQRRTNDASLFDVEKQLRNDKASFELIRKLSPTRYRFRVMNAQGVDVRTLSELPCHADSDTNTNEHVNGHTKKADSSTETEYQLSHSTRIECAEPKHAPYFVPALLYNFGSAENSMG